MISIPESDPLQRWARRIIEALDEETIINEYLSSRAYPLELRLAIVQQLMPSENLPKKLVEIVESFSNPD